MHVPSHDVCVECHSPHRLEVRANTCTSCHPGTATQQDLYKIRLTPTDFDGDGDASEGLSQEVETMRMELMSAIQSYTAGTLNTPIAYNSLSYPYWFKDNNGNGQADPDESVTANRYNQWSPRLLQAAYNFQWATKDPGAFAHNGQYILQVLYDSLRDVGGNVAGKTRPAVR